jgi:hypothetical protein
VPATLDLTRYIGSAIEQLPLKQQKSLAGLCAAYELYTPQTVPLRKVAALATSMPECVQQLLSRGLDPRSYEYIGLK